MEATSQKQPKITVNRITPDETKKITVKHIPAEKMPTITVKKVITKEQNSQYYNTFKNKNENIVRKKFTCELCGGRYTYYNKSKHNSSLKHKKKADVVYQTNALK